MSQAVFRVYFVLLVIAERTLTLTLPRPPPRSE